MAPPQRETQSVGGVDVGISPLAVGSGGEHPNPEAHYQPVQTSNGNWQYPNPRAYGKAVVKMVDLVTNCRRPFLKARSPPRRRPNSSRRLRPGVSPGNTDRIPTQATPRASARRTA